jgi:PAS domain S-box-containing protein
MGEQHPVIGAPVIDLLFEEAGVGRCLVGPDGILVRANADWLRSTGYTLEQVLGKDVIDFFPEPRDRVLAAMARALAGQRVEFPRHARRIDGRKTQWEGSIDPVPMDGEIGLLITAREVTQQEQIEEALREGEARYRLLFQNMLDGFAYCRMLYDEQGRPEDFIYLDPNAAFTRLTGLLDVVGKRASEVFPGIRDSEPELLRTYGRVARTGRPEKFEAYFRPLAMWLSLSVYSPHANHFVAVFDNVTEQKRAQEALRQSEERLRALADSMPQLAWTARSDGYITWYNRRWYEYTGTTPEQMEGWGWQSVHDPATLPDVVHRWRESIATSTPFEMEFPLRGADGRFRRFLTRIFPLKDQDGQVLQWFGTNTDVTALVEAQESLQEAARRKDEFLGMLSHELRNPLAPIRNSIYVLEHADPTGEQAARARAVIQRQTEHLTHLVDDLLDVTRIARGKIELRCQRVDLRDVVRRATEDFRSGMEDRGIAFHTAFSEEKLWADADPTRVTQVVGNLLHNAAKFTSRGGEVTLALRAIDGEAELSVRDTGTGIDPALIPHVFDAFVQGERTLARTEGGLGLGLALVKGITELHGGRVRAESAGKEKGAEFVVRLPLAVVAGLRDAPPTAVERTSLGRRILVVDDNADAAESLAEIMMMLGHAVEVAYDGPSAIERARVSPPDVVLCDIGLPGMSGYEVAKALRAEGTGGMLLIAVSGYAQSEDVKKAVEAGFDGHVAKPCDPAQIERLLG